MNAYATSRVRRIARQYDIATYADETGEQIADRIDQMIQRHQAALDHIRQGESSYPGDAADITSMWDCERCLALQPCERHDDAPLADDVRDGLNRLADEPATEPDPTPPNGTDRPLLVGERVQRGRIVRPVG